MIAVIFEVWPAAEHKEAYLETAKALRQLLESVDGFISVERFENLYESGKILSLSFFESEAAVMAWRNTPEHRKAQALGRGQHFKDYRLRIARVSRDYGMHERADAPRDSVEVFG